MTKADIQFVRSLHQKKFRREYGLFIVEGEKLVQELLASDWSVDRVFVVEDWRTEVGNPRAETVTEEELRKISTHENPNKALAIARIPKASIGNQQAAILNGLVLACDNLSDPGNAGTIIRTAEWFGISHVFFSENSVDIYNPKTVSAAKGSLFRTACSYIDLKELFTTNKHLPVLGTFMQGESLYETQLGSEGILLIGNEANGISEELFPFITKRISIPSFGKAESLNAAVATAVVLSELKRRTA